MHRSLVFTLLLVCAHAGALAAQSRTQVIPLFTLAYPPPPIAGADSGGVVFTGRHAFFGTDGGLFRATLPLGPPPERVAFEWTPVTGLAWNGTALYVALDTGHPTGPGAETRSLLRSGDDGVTWTPIDDQLEECLGVHCMRLTASQVEAFDDLLFVNAGGNVLASDDEGASWSILFGASSTGRPQGQACYDPAFALAGRRLLIGGECPLDMAYFRTGTLAPDLLSWEEQPASATTPVLENRNVQFIRRRGESQTVFAGIEGAILRSDDAGSSYAFVLHYDGDDPKYPYVTHIVFPSAWPSAIVVAGFDKANGGPFLSVSTDDGYSWRDDSSLLPGAGDERWSVTALAESPDGRIVIGVEDDGAGMLHVSELRLAGAPGRRRAVRH